MIYCPLSNQRLHREQLGREEKEKNILSDTRWTCVRDGNEVRWVQILTELSDVIYKITTGNNMLANLIENDLSGAGK